MNEQKFSTRPLRRAVVEALLRHDSRPPTQAPGQFNPHPLTGNATDIPDWLRSPPPAHAADWVRDTLTLLTERPDKRGPIANPNSRRNRESSKRRGNPRITALYVLSMYVLGQRLPTQGLSHADILAQGLKDHCKSWKLAPPAEHTIRSWSLREAKALNRHARRLADYPFENEELRQATLGLV